MQGGPPELTPEQATELSKRVLQVDTRIGLLASVHLSKVNTLTGENVGLARTAYKWIFDAHDVVMGDCNTEWALMVGADDPTRSSSSSKSAAKIVNTIRQGAWVSGTTHTCVHRPSYLPAKPNSSLPIQLKPIDLIVVKRPPFSVSLQPKQPGPKLPATCKFPRGLMKSTRWPSDHLPVVAAVKKPGMVDLKVATWNVADPHYFARFFEEGPGMGFDWQPEPERLEAILQQVVTLLTIADVIGLQEVPAGLVARLAASGASRQFHVQWVAAPSLYDKDSYATVVGKRGDSLKIVACAQDPSHDLDSLPQVAHDMLFTRYSSLKNPPNVTPDGKVDGTLTAVLVDRASIAPMPVHDASGASVLHGNAGKDLPGQVQLVQLSDGGADELHDKEVADSWEDL